MRTRHFGATAVALFLASSGRGHRRQRPAVFKIFRAV